MSATMITDEATFALERAVERRIRERTWGRIRNLHINVEGHRLTIHGTVASYYLKQLAIEAARGLLDPKEGILLVAALEVV